jgi:hypothetical protein
MGDICVRVLPLVADQSGSRTAAERKLQVSKQSQPIPSAVPKHAALSPWPRRNVLRQPWTIDLFGRLAEHINENASGGSVRRTWRYNVRRVLVYAEKSGLTGEQQITPAWLASIPPQLKGARFDHGARTLLGRLLVRIGAWPETHFELLKKNIATAAPVASNDARRSPIVPNPPKEFCELVFALAQRCAVSTGEMQWLRMGDCGPDGLRIVRAPRLRGRNGSTPGRVHLPPARLIVFGDDWDQLPKATFEAYVEREHPTDFLFFARSPRDKRKPVSRQTLASAVNQKREGAIQLLREEHFCRDFNRARDLRELRFHLRNVHGLSNSRVHQIICGRPASKRSGASPGLLESSAAFPVPAPYFVAAICASGSLLKGPTLRPGATERSRAEWQRLLGRYRVTVDWPTDFLNGLQGRGRRAERALRLLYRIAWEQWFAGRLMKPHKAPKSNREDREILEGFSKTIVEVVDTSAQGVWSGNLFEFHSRKRTSYVPLIEAMNGAAWRNQCKVCMHPDRHAIDRDIRQAQENPGRVKGLKAIASARGVSYASLMRHAGRRPPVPRRGEVTRSHLGGEFSAPSVRYPKVLAERIDQLNLEALLILPLISFSGASLGVSLSGSMVGEATNAELSDHRLSLALASLRNSSLIGDFRKSPGGFLVELPATN